MSLPCGDVAVAPSIRPLISRFTILILGAVLVSLGVGAHLPTDRASHCLVWGSYGLLAYCGLELTAKYRTWRKYFETHRRSGHKLDQFVTSDLTIRSSNPERKAGTGSWSGPDPSESSAQHLLVGDNDPLLCKQIRSMLYPMRIRVLCCSHPEEALELARNAGAVLCEVHLDNSTGLDVVRDLRRWGFRGPIIMMSSDSSRSTIDASIQAGIDDFLIKPFTVDALVNRLRRLILEKSDSGQKRSRDLSA